MATLRGPLGRHSEVLIGLIRGHSEALRGTPQQSECNQRLIRGSSGNQRLIRGNQRHSEVISGPQRAFGGSSGATQRHSEGIISNHSQSQAHQMLIRGQSEAIRGNRRLIRGNQRHSEAISGPQRAFGGSSKATQRHSEGFISTHSQSQAHQRVLRGQSEGNHSHSAALRGPRDPRRPR